MKSKTIILGLVMVLIAVHLGGCVEKEHIVDTYRHPSDEGMLYIANNAGEIRLNETYLSGINWNYNISEFLIDISPFVIDGRDLIDPDGDRWVRD